LCAWRVNWQDKATNIRELSDELNLGLESFVFVDDNPVECALVRDLIPEVTVLQVPKKLYSYPPILDTDGLFDTLALSSEDKRRSEMYRDEAKRKEDKAKYVSLDQYLESLSISIIVHRAEADEIQRIAQLTQKTNQFNLTTKRYSDSQISAFVKDSGYEVLTLSVTDKFGKSGLTGVIIARHANGVVEIDTFLLSCRILGRNIEIAFVLKSVDFFERKWGSLPMKAVFIPTKKNQQVRDFWKRIGFVEASCSDEQTIYELPIDSPRHKPIPYILIEE